MLSSVGVLGFTSIIAVISLTSLIFILHLVTSRPVSRSLYRRWTSDNWLQVAYRLFNDEVYPFHENISRSEQAYIEATVDDFDHEVEFENGYEISPYSFSVTIDFSKAGAVNPTRVNIGSVERDISERVRTVLSHMGVRETCCETGYKYYGIGWDLRDEIVKFYSLKHDRSQIKCYVYKVKRDDAHNVVSAVFDTKKTYAVGKRKTIMHKSGMVIEQMNASRVGSKDMGDETANAWVGKMQRLGFILDTYSRYDGKINLYFD